LFDANLLTAITLYNPFSANYYKEGTMNYSVVAPYKNYTYHNSKNNMLMFNISYKFSAGRNSSSTSIKYGMKAGGGTVNKKSAQVN
jgi:hypothetical protein